MTLRNVPVDEAIRRLVRDRSISLIMIYRADDQDRRQLVEVRASPTIPGTPPARPVAERAPVVAPPDPSALPPTPQPPPMVIVPGRN